MNLQDARQNGYAAKWAEVAARNRFRLDAVDLVKCDGFTTEETPISAMPAGVPVEIKACKKWIQNGGGERTRGQFHIGGGHEPLLEDDGEYALVVYDHVPRGPNTGAILALRIVMCPATSVERLRCGCKLPWAKVLNKAPRPNIYMKS